MPPLRYIITIILVTLLAACSQQQGEQKVQQGTGNKIDSQRYEPNWQPPYPPQFTILLWDEVQQEKGQIKAHIKTRKPVIPFWITSRQPPSEIKSGHYSTTEPSQRKRKYFMSNNLPLTDPYTYLFIQFDNDVFLSMDYYYTNGVQFQYTHPVLQRSRILSIAIPYRKKSINYYGIKLIQNMYTPTRLDLQQIIEGDRPFASYLYLGFYKTTFDSERKLKILSGLDIGMLGPTSLGGLIQTTIHSTEPTGWVNQIGNDVVLSYHAMIEKGILENRWITWNISGGGIIGTLYDNAYLSSILYMGKKEPFFKGFGLQCNKNKTPSNFQYSIFSGLKTTVIGYDATLQGGLFNNNDVYSLEKDEIERFTFSAIAGFKIKYKWFGLTGKVHYISPEFKGGRDHKWVSIGTTFCL